MFKHFIKCVFLCLFIYQAFAHTAFAQDFDATKLLAEQGDAQAQVLLGTMYDNGLGVPEDDVEAVTWFRKSA